MTHQRLAMGFAVVLLLATLAAAQSAGLTRQEVENAFEARLVFLLKGGQSQRDAEGQIRKQAEAARKDPDALERLFDTWRAEAAQQPANLPTTLSSLIDEAWLHYQASRPRPADGLLKRLETLSPDAASAAAQLDELQGDLKSALERDVVSPEEHARIDADIQERRRATSSAQRRDQHIARARSVSVPEDHATLNSLESAVHQDVEAGRLHREHADRVEGELSEARSRLRDATARSIRREFAAVVALIDKDDMQSAVYTWVALRKSLVESVPERLVGLDTFREWQRDLARHQRTIDEQLRKRSRQFLDSLRTVSPRVQLEPARIGHLESLGRMLGAGAGEWVNIRHDYDRVRLRLLAERAALIDYPTDRELREWPLPQYDRSGTAGRLVDAVAFFKNFNNLRLDGALSGIPDAEIARHLKRLAALDAPSGQEIDKLAAGAAAFVRAAEGRRIVDAARRVDELTRWIRQD